MNKRSPTNTCQVSSERRATNQNGRGPWLNNNNNLFTLSYSMFWFASSTIVATCNVFFPNVRKRRNIIRFHLSTVVVDVLVKLLLLISIDCCLVNTLKVAPLNSCTRHKKIQTKGTIKSCYEITYSVSSFLFTIALFPLVIQ